jgi:hypothetical protein
MKNCACINHHEVGAAYINGLLSVVLTVEEHSLAIWYGLLSRSCITAAF